MSRSKKKNPFNGFCSCGGSEKKDKRFARKGWRRQCKMALHHDKEVFPLLRETSDVWGMCKDGKFRFDPTTKWGKKLMRK